MSKLQVHVIYRIPLESNTEDTDWTLQFSRDNNVILAELFWQNKATSNHSVEIDPAAFLEMAKVLANG